MPYLGLLGALLSVVALAACEERTPCQELLRARKERCERCGGCEEEYIPEEDEIRCDEDDAKMAECVLPCKAAPCSGGEYNECYLKCAEAAAAGEL